MIDSAQLGTVGILTFVLVASLLWVGLDARRRQRSSVVVVLLCLITWPLGFLFWRIVRPPPPLGARAD